VLCDFENRFKISLAKSHHKCSKLNESMLKRFFLKQKTLNFTYKKKFDAEILYGSSWSNCGWKIDKTNNKSIKEKNPVLRIEPILTKLMVFSNFLDTHKNWCKTTTGSEWYVLSSKINEKLQSPLIKKTT
jgi:hypothetical protein